MPSVGLAVDQPQENTTNTHMPVAIRRVHKRIMPAILTASEATKLDVGEGQDIGIGGMGQSGPRWPFSASNVPPYLYYDANAIIGRGKW
jgi:hypothetical protein